MPFTAADIPDQSGKTILVTGANSGLGFETAKALSARGAHVIMTARDVGKGEDAAARIRDQVPGASVELRLLDLADLKSVSALSAALHAEKLKLDVLINNAGVMMPPRQLTKQGFESQIGVNHLAHFALTLQLFDLLNLGGDARVVTVSSAMHRQGRIDFDDLQGEHEYGPTRAYAQSKIANIYFGLELMRKCAASGKPVKSLMAHPGYASTNLQSTGPTGIARLVMQLTNPIFGQSAAEGALPTLYAATMPDARTGECFGPTGFARMRGAPGREEPIDLAMDKDIAKRLWQISEELTGTHWAA